MIDSHPLSIYSDMKRENSLKSKDYPSAMSSSIKEKKKSNVKKIFSWKIGCRGKKTQEEDKRETSILMHQKTEKGRNIIQNNCLAFRFCHPSSKPTVCKKVREQAMEEIFPNKRNKCLTTHIPWPEIFSAPRIWIIFKVKMKSWFNAVLFIGILPSSLLKMQQLLQKHKINIITKTSITQSLSEQSLREEQGIASIFPTAAKTK